jgi:hypothetical protein
MTEDRFDELTRRLATGTSRRGLLKGMAAVALGGVAARVRGGGGGDAEARARVSMACARLGQPCNTVPGTPGNQICCPHLICGDELVCCKDGGETCMDDTECCADHICRPNPDGLGNRCLPPGDIGAECLEDEDCLSSLACSVEFGTCGIVCGESICGPDDICDPYTLMCTTPGICAGLYEACPEGCSVGVPCAACCGGGICYTGPGPENCNGLADPCC